ncbi:MAG: OmpP1/FadL family transporter [Mangrovibacterium sp.]
MIKKIFLSVGLCSLAVLGFSQNMVDAYRLSNVHMQGTARATAMGNAFGALGGDFTSASINPAGIGMYMSDELEMTMQVGNYKNQASYLGSNTDASNNNFSIPNLGYVVSLKTDPRKNSSLVSVNLGIGYNRMSNFNTNTVIRGNGATSSMLDQFVENATTGYASDFYEGVAAGAGAIYQYADPETGDYTGPYYHDMQKVQDGYPSENFAHDQKKTIYQSGSLDEYIFSLAFNFNHKLYFGATFGIQNVNFEESSTMYEGNVDYEGHRESGEYNSYLNEYGFNQYLETWGTGLNAKFGLIYKPIKQLRLGLAVHTPTYYRLHDSYSTYMYNDYDLANTSGGYNNYTDEAYSDSYGAYDYQINSPMKAILSAAYVIGKRASISVDYEYLNYDKMKLKNGGDGYNFDYENTDVQNTFKSVGNLHVGGEYRVTNALSLRGGYEYLESPYETNGWQGATQTYSAGIGYRFGRYYIDAAYKHIGTSSKLQLYDMPLGVVNKGYDEVVTSPIAKMNYKRNLYTVTLGMRF